MKYSTYAVLWIILIVIALFVIVKPARIVFPQLAGVKCYKEWICVENSDRLNRAKTLYDSSLSKIEAKLSKFKKKPRVVFCSSYECFSRFGFHKAAGKSIGGFGVVIGPRGWKSHYLEHELIHQWQSSHFGAITVSNAPKWIIEGMAYAVSDDPRKKLSEPFQSYRKKYNKEFGQLSGLDLELALQKNI